MPERVDTARSERPAGIIDSLYLSQFVDPRSGEVDWDDVEEFEREKDENGE